MNARRTPTAAAVLSVALVACSSEPGVEETQPVPQASFFSAGDFGEIPIASGAETVGQRSEIDGVVSDSWKVRDMTPEQVVRWYASTLPSAGWDGSEGPRTYGATWRGEWTKDGRLLEVVAQAYGGGVDDGQTQVSLVLYPDVTGAPLAPLAS